MKNWFVTMLLFACLLTGCGKADNNAEAGETSMDEEVSATTQNASVTSLNVSELFSDRDYEIGYDESECVAILLEGETASCDSSSVEISGGIVTIKAEGSFLLSGNLDNGMIVVEVADTDKVQLILENVSIVNDTSAAIYVKQADKVFVTTTPDSENVLTNGGQYVAVDDNNIDAVVFAKDDLTLNGAGTLIVNAKAGHGIVSKDSLTITCGTYKITSESHGLNGKDSVEIANGTFDIDAGNDGIHAENSDDLALGTLYIQDGTYRIAAVGDGISAQSILQIDGGVITVDSVDDALHSNGNIVVNSGEFTLKTEDDGAHADNNLTIMDGTWNIEKCYEGLEGQSIDIADGTITIVASDDALNAAGGNDQSGTGGMFGGKEDIFAVDENAYIAISGGKLHLQCGGDGIDSNGNIQMSGGEIYISGPENGGNGSMDYTSGAQITGGSFCAVGYIQMALNFDVTSTQGSMLVSVGNQKAGSQVVLTDSTGNVLMSYEALCSFDSVLISTSQIKAGETYILTVNGETTEVTMESLIYGNGTMGGFMNMPGGMTPPEGMEMPEGMTPPGGMEMPGGMTPPGGMEQPEGMMPQEGMVPPGGSRK